MGCCWPGSIANRTSHLTLHMSHVTQQFMSSSANVLVSASFPTAVSSDWQIRVVLIGCGPLAAVDLLPKVCRHHARVVSTRARRQHSPCSRRLHVFAPTAHCRTRLRQCRVSSARPLTAEGAV
jgi:hypothetical protein